MNKTVVSSLVILGFFISSAIANAHPGRTDASGCHTCKTNCANWGLSSGEYHCHNAKALPQPEEPIKSTYGENGTGYTTPAPEYGQPKNEQESTFVNQEAKVGGMTFNAETEKVDAIVEEKIEVVEPVVKDADENVDGEQKVDVDYETADDNDVNPLTFLFLGMVGVWLYKKFKSKP